MYAFHHIWQLCSSKATLIYTLRTDRDVAFLLSEFLSYGTSSHFDWNSFKRTKLKCHNRLSPNFLSQKTYVLYVNECRGLFTKLHIWFVLKNVKTLLSDSGWIQPYVRSWKSSPACLPPGCLPPGCLLGYFVRVSIEDLTNSSSGKLSPVVGGFKYGTNIHS